MRPLGLHLCYLPWSPFMPPAPVCRHIQCQLPAALLATPPQRARNCPPSGVWTRLQTPAHGSGRCSQGDLTTTCCPTMPAPLHLLTLRFSFCFSLGNGSIPSRFAEPWTAAGLSFRCEQAELAITRSPKFESLSEFRNLLVWGLHSLGPELSDQLQPELRAAGIFQA